MTSLSDQYIHCAANGGTCSPTEYAAMAYASAKNQPFCMFTPWGSHQCVSASGPIYRTLSGTVACNDTTFSGTNSNFQIETTGNQIITSGHKYDCYSAALPKDIETAFAGANSTFYTQSGTPSGFKLCTAQGSSCKIP